MAPTIKERFKRFQEIQHKLSRAQSEMELFEKKAAQCWEEKMTGVQEAMTGVQEAVTGVQEATLAQEARKLEDEARKLADEATTRVQKADTLAKKVEALMQKAKELAAYFEGKVVYFSTTDEALALAVLKKEYHISVCCRISIKLERGIARADLRALAKKLNILE